MKTLVKNEQLLFLFLCNFAILFIGFGLFPLLPLYASDLGANSTFIGAYLAITYIAISLGSILAGQLSERVPRKALFVSAGLLGVPSLFLLGHIQSLWQLVVLTALVWFAGGIGLSLANVLTGLQTTSATRGKAFGLLSLSSPLGALVGGLISGRIVEQSGYPMLFMVLSVVWSMYPILAMTKIQYKPICPPSRKTDLTKVASLQFGTSFLILLATILIASMTVSVGRMGLSMTMKDKQFSVNDVSMTNAFGGLVTIPITLLIGVLADKLGRKRFLLMGYLVAMGGSLMLISAQSLWQFWLISSLVLASRSVITSMSPAYATDLLPRRSLGKALPLVGTMNWVSGVIGFAGSGFMLDVLGSYGLYGIAALSALLAGIILAFLPASLASVATRPIPEASDTLTANGD